MKYERIYDTDFVIQCLTHDHIWDYTRDDTPIDKDLFFPPMGDGVIWLKAEDYGVFMGQKMNHITYEVHTILLPHARGKAVQIAKGAITWVFTNTNCLRVTTSVPSYNRLAARLSEKCGMTLFGTNIKSFQKDGVLYDQFLYGISKEEICPQ